MQNSSNRVQALIRRFKSELKMLLEACLVFMVYCIFCNTFGDGTVASVGDVLVTAALQFFVLISAKIGAWYYMKLLFRDEPRLRVMGLFGCVHKTVAAGVTLLQAVYGDDPSIGLLTLPLLLYHPSQLVVGSMIAPHLEKWVRSEELRLCLRELPRDHKETVISQIHAVDVEIRGPI
jgi:sodium/bile acid cotransporter 7